MPTPARKKAPASRRKASPEHDASTRERILDVALESFAELGFDGSSTRGIASRAGVNQGLIPYYFKTKEALWKEAVTRAFARLREQLVGIGEAEGISERERLALMIRRFVRFVGAHPEFVRMMHEEGKREGPRMRWLVDTHVRPLFDGITSMRERAVSEGGLPHAIDAPYFHYIFAGAVSVIFHQAPECRRLFGVDPNDPAVVESHADALIQIFLGDSSLGREASPREGAPQHGRKS